MDKKEQEEVKRSKDILLKTRLRTLIKDKGMSEADFYNSLGLIKQYWYMISWGLCETPLNVKIKISKALNSDSALIWQEEQEK